MSFEHANIVNILKSTPLWTKKTLSGLLTMIKKAMTRGKALLNTRRIADTLRTWQLGV
jgi:hypothetical protein